jgi:hypothetical protein
MEAYRGRVDLEPPPFNIDEAPHLPVAPAVSKVAPRATLPVIRDESQGAVVAKKRKEEPRIRAIKTLNGLSPCTPFDQELLAEIGHGREVEITIHQDRSLPHHRLYWSLLHTIVQNSDHYRSATDLHESLKIALGVTRRIKLLTPSEHATIAKRIRQRMAQCLMWVGGLLANLPMASKISDALTDSMADLEALETECETIVLPGSTGFWSMDQVAFRKYFDAACRQLTLAGYDVEVLIEETKKQIGTRYRSIHNGAYQPERDHVQQQTASAEPAPFETDPDQESDSHGALQERGNAA